ncbi:hypothetical protein BCR44DRAFT_33622 [Catenaria anguillulae PL171]|uniref:Uncharacterized protein n=1 Tax=Catenaria anguillulae PL171 TaxID=765915 RepID=A0A1Y2HJJ6_9FUNG|nr:hypothetical protein BCR44DRAFT_33622 [Catenaria anguillulae PL171]
MSLGTKVAAALGIGAIALVAVVVATVMLRRSGARERKRTRRASGSLSIEKTPGQPQFLRPASPFVQAQTSGYRPAVAFASRMAGGHALPVEEKTAKWISFGSKPSASPSPASTPQLPPTAIQLRLFDGTSAPPAHPSTLMSAISPMSLADRILPPSPMLLASPAAARPHVSRPIVGLNDASRSLGTAEWELPSATVGRAGEDVESRVSGSDKRVRWVDGVQSAWRD